MTFDFQSEQVGNPSVKWLPTPECMGRNDCRSREKLINGCTVELRRCAQLANSAFDLISFGGGALCAWRFVTRSHFPAQLKVYAVAAVGWLASYNRTDSGKWV